MREKYIEQQLMMATSKMGGIALKFASPSYAGMPDRLLLLPDGVMAFVEVKAPGKMPRPLQLKRHAMLRRLGFPVFVLDNAKDIPKILTEVFSSQDGGRGKSL